MDIPQRSMNMIRYIVLNKWFFFGFGFLVIFAGLCYLWFQHTTTSYKRDLLESEGVVLQTDTPQNLHRSIETEVSVSKMSDSVANTSAPTEMMAVKTGVIVKNVDQNETTKLIQKHEPETAEVRVSPHGFGPYPEIPADYPRQDLWDYPDFVTAEHELLLRVQVKLWKQGVQTAGGGMIDGRIYPNIPGTVYIKWENRVRTDGTVERYALRMYGDPYAGKILRDIINLKGELHENDIPKEINVIEADEGGIDPYQFLDIK